MIGIRVLWLEVVNSSLLRLGPLVVAAGAVAAWSAVWSGLFVWENRAAASIVALAVVVPLIAALSALDATRVRRFGLRPMWRLAHGSGFLAAVAIIVSHWLVSIGLFASIVAVAHLPVGVAGVPQGGPSMIWLMAGFAACVLGASFGSLMGFLVPFLPTVLAVPVVAYAGFAALFLVPAAETHQGVARLSPLYQVVVDPFLVLDWTPFVGQGLWFTAAATTLSVGVLVRCAPRRPVVWGVLLVVASLAAGLGFTVASDDSSIVEPEQAHAFVCRGDSPSLCLTPEYEPAREEIQQVLRDAHERVVGTALDFDTVEVRTRGTESPVGSGRVPLHIDDLSPGWAQRSEFEMFDALLDPERTYCRGTPLDPAADPFESARVVVRSWAAGDESGLLSGLDVSPALSRFANLSTAERKLWLEANRDGICTGLLADVAD